MSSHFPKSTRILKRKEFKRRSSGSNKCSGRLIYVEYRKNFNSQSRLGITVTKRYGKAYQRNRIKRLIREAFRVTRHQLPDHYDIFVKPKMVAHHKKMKDIQSDFDQLVKQLSI